MFKDSLSPGVGELLWSLRTGRSLPKPRLREFDAKNSKGCPKTGVPDSAQVASRYYRAPEVVLGSAPAARAADAWALGVTLAECASGRLLFTGRDNQCGIPPLVLGYPLEFFEILAPLVESNSFPAVSWDRPVRRLLVVPRRPEGEFSKVRSGTLTMKGILNWLGFHTGDNHALLRAVVAALGPVPPRLRAAARRRAKHFGDDGALRDRPREPEGPEADGRARSPPPAAPRDPPPASRDRPLAAFLLDDRRASPGAAAGDAARELLALLRTLLVYDPTARAPAAAVAAGAFAALAPRRSDAAAAATPGDGGARA